MSKHETFHKFETSSHHLPRTRLITSTEAGPLFRMPVSKLIDTNPITIELPDYIQKVLRTHRNRSRFMRTMNWNSRIGPRWLGKPNSAFFSCCGENSFIDYLEEDVDFERSSTCMLHDIMRGHVDYNHTDCIYGKVTSLSGHIAPLNITEKPTSHIMTFDAFRGPDAFNNMPRKMQGRVIRLYESRILPLTQDGFLIRAKQQSG